MSDKKRVALNILSVAVVIASAGLAYLNSWIDKENLNETVEEKVNEALAEREKES